MPLPLQGLLGLVKNGKISKKRTEQDRYKNTSSVSIKSNKKGNKMLNSNNLTSQYTNTLTFLNLTKFSAESFYFNKSEQVY